MADYKGTIKKVEDKHKELHKTLGANNAAKRWEGFQNYVNTRTNPDIRLNIAGQEVTLQVFEAKYAERFVALKTWIDETVTAMRDYADQLCDDLDGKITP